MTTDIVRPARKTDRERLADFQMAMALETEGKTLDRSVLLRGVGAALGDSGRGRYIVLERDGVVVGALFLTLEWSEWRDGWWFWIQSVYTAPEARATGVYKALYEAVMTEARERDDTIGVRLYVESSNSRAQAVYQALGMKKSSYEFYEVSLLDGAD
jgi:GNAT superfamily N-acetyltransferase